MEQQTQAFKFHRQSCEVYSRVVGYIRPVDSWNRGKQSEFKDRKSFKIVNNFENDR